MDEISFRNWLHAQGVKKKVSSDIVSRLKRIEREIKDCDLDEYYLLDRCSTLMNLFAKMGQNEVMKKYPNTTFPIGSYTMNSFRHALKKYMQFKETTVVIKH